MIPTIPNTDVASVLAWDSDHFGFPIARVAGHRLDRAIIDALLRWCDDHAVECVYFLADADDAVTAQLANEHGFRFADVRITLARALSTPIDRAPGEARLREARLADIGALEAIASTAHADSRFYFDGAFPRDRCDALYSAWIANAVRGRADTVLVAEHGGRVAGYLSITRPAADEGRIDLLAVDAAAQGLGLGRALTAAAMSWCAEHGCARVTVATQGRNVRAQALYQRAGFTTTAVDVWYHLWRARARA
jgi:ribosomal protein S18 acetylase RimI-like enzyme